MLRATSGLHAISSASLLQTTGFAGIIGSVSIFQGNMKHRG